MATTPIGQSTKTSGQPLSTLTDMDNTFQFEESAFELLACPACTGDLRLDDSHLRCVACGRMYPVIGGIPVLIAERANSTNLKK